jgi:HEAT repeat protein
MTKWYQSIILVAVACLAMPVAAQTPDDISKADAPIPSAEEKQAAQSTADLLKKAQDYDFGQSREPLVELEKLIRDFGGQPGPLAMIERQLLGQLRSKASAGLTDFICRQLSLIGSEQAVDVLIPMLTNPKVADMARYALERIPGAQVDQKLRSSLKQVPEATRVGIVATLGVRQDKKAVSVLAQYLTEDDAQLATAVAAALGRIGTPEAGAALLEKKDQVAAGVQQRLLDALLSCAEQLLDQDKPAEAAKLYEQLSQVENSRVIRIGALRGLAEAQPQDLGKLIVSVLEEEDRDLIPTALSLVARMEDDAQIRQVGEKMADLSTSDQVRMLASMAQGGSPAALAYVKNAAKSRDPSVRSGALRALAVLGDASCVGILANAATQADLQRTARESLYRMAAPGVDDEIIRLIKASDESAVQVELIQSVSARGIDTAAPVLLTAVQNRNRAVQRAAFKALAVLGRPQDIPVLTGMLMARPQRAIEDALVAIAETHDKEDSVAESVLDQADTASATAKQAVLRVVTRLGEDRGLAFVEQQVQATNLQVRTAAVRALSSWSTRTPMPLALRIAKDDDNLTRRILAFRGYVTMTVLPSDESAEQVFAALARAMAIAARDEEKKMVLSALPKAPCKAALDFAQQQLKDPQLRAEAQTAIVGICDGLVGSDPSAVREVLTKLLKGKMNKNVEDAAKRVLTKLNK